VLEALKLLKQEEKKQAGQGEQRIMSEVEKAKSVRNQKKLNDLLFEQRILMQKMVSGARRLPQGGMVSQFRKTN
jgi:hypothetical protein